MADTDPFPDDVPLADAVEQQRAAAELSNDDAEDHAVLDDTDAPLESNASDWQEQQEVVEDPDADEPR